MMFAASSGLPSADVIQANFNDVAVFEPQLRTASHPNTGGSELLEKAHFMKFKRTRYLRSGKDEITRHKSYTAAEKRNGLLDAKDLVCCVAILYRS